MLRFKRPASSMRTIVRVMQVLVDARGRKGVGGPDFAPVLADGFRAFRTIDAEAGGEGLRVGKYVVADPGERQIGDDLFVGPSLSNRLPLTAETTRLSKVSITPLGRPVVPEV